MHRAHKRAVVRGRDRYLKIFRPRQSAEAAARHARMNALLGAEDFLTPQIVSYTPGCLTLAGLPGRSLFELGNDPAGQRCRLRESLAEMVPGLGPATIPGAVPPSASRPRGAPAPHGRRRTGEPAAPGGPVAVHAQDIPAGPGRARRRAAAAGQIAAVAPDRPRSPGLVARGPPRQADLRPRIPVLPWGCWISTRPAGPKLPPTSANLAVHLELRLRQRRLTPERYQTARRHVIATAEELRVTPARFDAYAAATRLRLACLYSFRPRVGRPGRGLPATSPQGRCPPAP